MCAWVDNSFHYPYKTALDKILKIPIMKHAEDILLNKPSTFKESHKLQLIKSQL